MYIKYFYISGYYVYIIILLKILAFNVTSSLLLPYNHQNTNKMKPMKLIEALKADEQMKEQFLMLLDLLSILELRLFILASTNPHHYTQDNYAQELQCNRISIVRAFKKLEDLGLYKYQRHTGQQDLISTLSDEEKNEILKQIMEIQGEKTVKNVIIENKAQKYITVRMPKDHKPKKNKKK